MIFGNGLYDLIASLAKVGWQRAVQGDLENAQDDRDRTDADPLLNAFSLVDFDMSKSCAKNTAQTIAPCAASPSLPEPSAAVMERFATSAAPVVKTS